jgi:hypothetical protein
MVASSSQGRGRGERIRTSGIQLPKLALYQAELRPETPESAVLIGVSEHLGKPEIGRGGVSWITD